ncbi:heparinase II/III family protein [Actinocatenispora rupis]|uniref:Heparinase n=1 Tax=Actinocatenispora rupis TaxID=519421 RepID=A0A8J3NE27_9ACTN|nr:heparinase II/III family protein [Actinocatenispora rupis]GID12119.1 heparinase [Actinocatenispora rupis]
MASVPTEPGRAPLTDRLPALHDPVVLARLLAGPAPLPTVADRPLWTSVPPAVRTAVLADAAADLTEPPPRLLASDWARTFRDGDRGTYETAVRRLRERVTRLVLAAVVTGDVADASAAPDACPYLDGVVDGVVLLAEASTWCWAPHDRGTAARGETVPDPGEPYLDLGAAEVAALLAWTDHVLGPHLDRRMPGLRRRIRREVRDRVLGPFERIRDWRWIGADGTANNWNPWIHGAVLTAALLLCDDPVRRAGLVRLVVAGLDHYVAVLPGDGGLDEGIAYWWQGPCRLLEALDLLAEVGGPELDARDLPVLAPLLRFPQRMHLGADWYVNVGDASARLSAEPPWQVPYRWAARLGQPETAAHAVSGASGRAVAPGTGLGRALAALADRAWCDAVAAPLPPGAAPWLADACWLPSTGVLVARETPGTTRGLALAVKAGHNGEHHNHLDVGSYQVAVDGRPLVVDVGRPTYTAETFGPRRYDGWPFRSAWHTVPEPGAEQCPGREYGARGVAVALDDGSATLRADLAGAYPVGSVARWIRTVRLVRGPGAYVEVVDEWVDAADPVLVRHVLAGRVQHGAGWATVTGTAGRRLRLSWDPAAAVASVDHRELTDPLLRRSWGQRLARLTLAVADAAAGRIAVVVRDDR